MCDRLPLTLTLSPKTGRGDTSLSRWAGEGWGLGGLGL